jgi:hypothetical protein
MSLRMLRRTPVRSVAVSSDQDAVRERRTLCIGIILLALPLAAFGLLHWIATGADAQIVVPTEHFLAVSAACIVALLLAVVFSYARCGPGNRAPSSWPRPT